MTVQNAKWLLFFAGLFSQTQVRIIGKIGISEFCMTVLAPFLFLKYQEMMKRDKVFGFFVLIILWFLGAVVADVVNHIPFAVSARGLAVPATVFGSAVCLYVLLRRHPENFKWFIVGAACSFFLSIVVFQRGRSGDLESNAAAISAVMGYKLFWANFFATIVTVPLSLCYLKMPRAISVILALLVAGYNLSIGGRSAFACWVVSAIFLLIGGHDWKSIRRLSKFFVVVLALIALSGLGMKTVYRKLALSGMLGEDEAVKYQRQTAKGSGFVSLLVSGRAATFVGLYAAKDKPLLGHGTHALDTQGYWEDFVVKYGDAQDIAEYRNFLQRSYGLTIIPEHSHIIAYWLWHGVFGLIFWIYVIVLVAVTMKKRLYVAPALFGYFAVVVPSFFWDVFFSPFGLRVNEVALFVICLFVKRAYQQRQFI